MSDQHPCPRESDVLRAVERREWTPELEQHVAQCDDCRDVRAVAAALHAALVGEGDAPLPPASDIWWRAHWAAEREARQRAMRPIDTLERAEPLVALVAIVTLLVLRGDAIAARAVQWLAGDAGGQALQVLIPPALMPILIVGAGLCAFVLLVGLGAVLAND